MASPLQLTQSGKHNNSALAAVHLRAAPLASSMGAELHGLQLNESLSDAQFGDLRAALFRHGMVFLRRQNLSIADQERASHSIA